MTITLPLPPAQEERLRKKAQASGSGADEYVLGLILRDIQAERESETSGKSLAEMLAGRVGLFESDGPGYDAQEASQSFAAHLAEKHEAGHL